jgi:hypothetical protein
MQEAAMPQTDTPQEQPQRIDFFKTIVMLMRAPRAYFSEMPDMDWQLPAKISGISALFHVAVSFTYVFGRSVPLAVILFLNAMLMPVITASLIHMFMTMSMGRKTSIARIYAVVALATAPTLLFSWIPAAGFVTEPWRMLLIGFGLNKACEFSWKQSILLLVAAFGSLLLLLWSALPLITDLKHLLALG